MFCSFYLSRIPMALRLFPRSLKGQVLLLNTQSNCDYRHPLQRGVQNALPPVTCLSSSEYWTYNKKSGGWGPVGFFTVAHGHSMASIIMYIFFSILKFFPCHPSVSVSLCRPVLSPSSLSTRILSLYLTHFLSLYTIIYVY